MPETGSEESIPLPPSADDAEAEIPSGPGLLGSLRHFADTAIATVEDRVELLSLELHEEKNRLIRTFVWIVVFAFTALLALVFVSGAIVLAFWNTRGRLAAIVALAAAYTVCAVVAGIMARRRLSHPRPFAGTIDELRNDRACLRPRS